MSGRRVKALRRAFEAAHDGLRPKPAEIQKGPAVGLKGWRDVVKAAPSTIRQSKVTEMFLRRIFSIEVLKPSEWRRWKRDFNKGDN